MSERVRGPGGTSGQALLELALVSLVFMILVLSLAEVGRAVWSYNSLAHAAREGTRYAIVHGASSADPSGPGSVHYTAPNQDAMVADRVSEHLGALNEDKLTVEAEWPDGDNLRGSKVRVTARYQFDSLFAGLLGLPSIPLVGSSTMTISY